MNGAPEPEIYNKILNLYALYNHASDWGTPEEYASCFSAEGRLTADSIDVQGRDALIAYKSAEQGRRPEIARRHINGSIMLAQQSDGRVMGICYLFAYNWSANGLILADSGVYVDEIIEEDGSWCFKARSLRFDRSQPFLPGGRSVTAVMGDDAAPSIEAIVRADLDRIAHELGDLPVDVRPLEEM